LAPGIAITYAAPVAYVGQDGNVYVTQVGKDGGIAITGDAAGPAEDTYYPFHQVAKFYTNLRWSPDGTGLAFVETQSGTLYVAQSGSAPKGVAKGIEASFPPFWSADSQSIAYAMLVPGSGQQSDNTVQYQVQSVPVAGGTSTVLSQFRAVAGCGGGSSSPAMTLIYNSEVGFGGGRLILGQTANGFVYSASCSGTGIAYVSSSGVVWQHPDLFRAALSPDGTQIAALQSTNGQQPFSLVKVDVASGNVTPLATKPGIDQLGWSGNSGNIVYSTIVFAQKLPAPPSTSTIGSQITSGNWPPPDADLTVNTVSLWKMPAAGGDSTLIASQPGFAIGGISGTPDSTEVVYSFIDSYKGVLDAIKANAPLHQVEAAYPYPKLAAASLTTSNPPTFSVFATGGKPAAGRGKFKAVK